MVELEDVEYQIPFCDPFPCPITGQVVAERGRLSEMALWGCMPPLCKRNMKIFSALIAVLSVLTTWLNIVVLSANLLRRTRRILRRNPTMQNYSNYVISLALADLVMGAFVMPLAIIFFYDEVLSTRVTAKINSTSLRQSISNNSKALFARDGPFDHTISIATPQNYTIKPEETAKTVNTILHFLGFFTHTSIFVSVYTLAASSADRFYVSTKPNKNNAIRLSRSSLRRLSITPSCGGPTFLACHISRSSVVVSFIWILGVLFALLPFCVPGCYYHHVGHMFAAASFNNNYNQTFSWYTTILSLPLVITWLFSFLLSLLLRRRKQKLKQSSKSLAKKETGERRAADRDMESSCAMISRCTETAPAHNATQSVTSEIASSANRAESLHDVFVNDEQVSDFPFLSAHMRNPPKLAPSASVPCPRKRRPSSLDSSLIACKVTDGKKIKSTVNSESDLRTARGRLLLKYHSIEDGLPAGYVAKRILFRRSWEGGVISEAQLQRSQDSNVSSFVNRSEQCSTSNTSMTSPPTSPSQAHTRRSDITRSARATSARARRRSSIFRAKEFIMSKSFESNIARTLVAVIIVFTVAVLPLLIVLSQIKPWDQSTPTQRNKDATSLVIAIAILLSNSFWNCLIYGTRMPYFRSSMAHILRKLFRCKQNVSCTKVLSRKLSLTSSFRRDSELSKPTWL